MKQAGASDSDTTAMATASCNGITIVASTDYCGNPVEFFEVWNLLKVDSKFLIWCEKSTYEDKVVQRISLLRIFRSEKVTDPMRKK